MDYNSLREMLAKSWSRDTAYRKDRDRWTPDKPSVGQCGVTVLVVNDFFGGQIIRGISTSGVEHYWNEIGNVQIDLTGDQFDEKMEFLSIEPVTREFLMSSGDVLDRYFLLRREMRKKLRDIANE